nr:MAG TPA: hypothetical protein [Caudoviricetes sp.]
MRHWHKYEINLFRQMLFCMTCPQIRMLCFNVIDSCPIMTKKSVARTTS